LVSVGREGEVQSIAPDRRATYFYGTLAPDGKRLAVFESGRDGNSIWIMQLAEKRWQRLTDGSYCVWSPTGDRIAFSSHREGTANLYVIRSDGEGPVERITRSLNSQWPYSWSPDGRVLAYEEQNSTTGTLDTWMVPVDRSAEPRQLASDAAVPSFSPDGRWIAYQSPLTGRPQVVVRPAAGPGAKIVVTGEGGLAPVWSADGQELFYLTRLTDTRVMSRRVESRSPLRFGPPRAAFALPFALLGLLGYHSRTYTVTPDGRTLVTVQPDERQPSEIKALQVIRHWPEEVRAKLAAQ
jgi:Tol biopolymer transport system component